MKTRPEIIWGTSLVALSAAVIFAGCSDSNTASAGSAGAAGPSGLAVPDTRAALPSGSQLWAQNCAMCHNSISPTTYSDGQWDVAVTHMRIQARLTGEEERQIRKFLQASN